MKCCYSPQLGIREIYNLITNLLLFSKVISSSGEVLKYARDDKAELRPPVSRVNIV